MTRRTRSHRSRGVLGAVIAGVAVWWLVGHFRAAPEAQASDPDDASLRAAHDRAAVPGLGAQLARARGRVPFALPAPELGGEVEVSGQVLDRYSSAPVADVEVVLRSPAGETSAISDDGGHYQLRVARGMYRAYVRSDAVISVARRAPIRLPGALEPDEVDRPDDAAMAMVLATADTDHVDLPVVQAGTLVGHVVDGNGAPVVGAIVQAVSTSGMRPVLGSDVAESARDGSFQLRVAAGEQVVSASHPRFAGAEIDALQIGVPAHGETTVMLTLAAGCVVTGRVVRADGSPASDGAIERRWDSDPGARRTSNAPEGNFTPEGKIAADGTFRWAGRENFPVALRAWPWKSAPSPAQTFACRDGARFDNVVLRLSAEAPVLAGMVRDADGAPAAWTYLHLEPVALGQNGFGSDTQQERSDGDGRYAFFHMSPGNYRVSVVSERGIAIREITLPQAGVDLTLSGTGGVHGTARLPDGALQVDVVGCEDVATAGPLAMSRLVPVHAGQFDLGGVPACRAKLVFSYLGHLGSQTVVVARDQVATLALDVDRLMASEMVQDLVEPDDPGIAEGEHDHDSEGDELGPDNGKDDGPDEDGADDGKANQPHSGDFRVGPKPIPIEVRRVN